MNLKKVLIIFLILVGIATRFYSFKNPIADWHSHRQADTLSVSKNFLNNKGSFLVPTYHDLSSVQSGKSNPIGYRMVELPIYNLSSALISKLTHLPIEQSSRLVNIVFSILTAILIYKLSNIWGFILALFLPFGIYYNHATLPETTGIFFLTLTIYLLEKKSLYFPLSFSLALLIKPYFSLILLPFIIYKIAKNKAKIFLIILTCLSLLPFLLWRFHIQKYSEGIPAYNWLFQQGFNNEKFVAFQPYWFRWLFWERLTKLILGFFLLPPFIIGLKNKKYISLFAGILLYFIIIARGNVQHDYYQSLTLPMLILIISGGLAKLNNKIAAFLVIAGLVVSGLKIKEYYHINNPVILAAGSYVNANLPPNSLVIAPYTGDTSFLYQTNRSGWPTEIYDFDSIIQEHPQNPIYLVSVNYDNYTNMVKKQFKTVFANQQFIVLDIKSKL